MICKYTTRHDIEIPDTVSVPMMVASPVSNAGHNRFTVTQKGTTEARQQTNEQASNEPVLKQASRYSAPCIVACKRIGQSSHDVRKLFKTPPRFDRIPPQDVNRITEEYVMACSKTLNDCRMLLSAESDRLPVTGIRSEGRDGNAVPMWKGSSCRFFYLPFPQYTRNTWLHVDVWEGNGDGREEEVASLTAAGTAPPVHDPSWRGWYCLD